MSHSLLLRSVRASVLACVAIWYGCAQPPERHYREPVSTTAERESLARSLQDNGELAEALVQWKILAIIDPINGYYKKQVVSTQQVIESKSKMLVSSGIANLQRGAREAARLSFLKALALDPKNKKALEHLRQF